MNQQSLPIQRIIATLYEQQRQLNVLTEKFEKFKTTANEQVQQINTLTQKIETLKNDSSAQNTSQELDNAIETYFINNAHTLKGKDGLDGRDGVVGKAGANGIHGTNGKPGKDGKPGPKGPPGKSGESFSVDKLSKKDITALKKALGITD